MNTFEQASRQKYRFPSSRGELTTEQLWDLPLTGKAGFDLDTIAKAVNAELRSASEESFVAVKTNAVTEVLQTKLDILKHIIAVRLAEAEERNKASSRKAERDRLMQILHEKKEQGLRDLSTEEIEKRIADLG